MKKLTAALVAVTCITIITSVFAGAYDLPQKYSSDSYTDPIPEIVIPDAPEEQKGILTYFNNSRMPLTKAPVLSDNTVYVPAEEFFGRLGFTVTSGSDITVSNDKVTATMTSGKDTCTVNGKEVVLEKKVKKIGGVVMCPANLISETLNAKVWYDEASMTFVVTTGKYLTDNILRIFNYKMWMNGEPLYELSFNKYDLFEQVASYYQRHGNYPKESDTIPAAEDALSLLAQHGFKTIRAFVRVNARAAYSRSEKQKEMFYTITDKVFELCDKYGIVVNPTLELPSDDFVVTGEDYFDLVCDPDSASRQELYKFIDEFVTRYKDRTCILMWEIVNEGNLGCDVGWAVRQNRYSLYQLGKFYTDCANRIRMNDPERVVTGGDGCLRPAQWHLYLGVKAGMIGADWTVDTLEDRLNAYTMLYSGIDVISGHCYSTGLSGRLYQRSEEDKEFVPESFSLLMEEAKRIGKVFYNGETAVNADEYNEEIYEKSLSYINDIIDAGVQLSHWWTFHNDCKAHMAEGYGWQITDGELLDAIIDGNRRLKEKYVVNYVSSANTNVVWGDSDITVADTVTDLPDDFVISTGSGCGASVGVSGGIMLSSAVLFAAAALIRKKKMTV